MSVIINLLCLLVIIAAHEYGHMYFAKRYGVNVPNFSVGMGPSIFSFVRGGTKYSLRLIPLGGFITIDEQGEKRLPPHQRALISFGGPLANLILALLVAMLALALGYKPGVVTNMSPAYAWLVVFFATIGIFLLGVPFSLYAFVDMLLHPIKNFDMAAGPFSILRGDGLPTEFLTGVPLGYQALIIIYCLSLSVGTFNLVPISMLDGGRIFRVLFAHHSRFIKVWDMVTGFLLLFFIVYILGGDLFKLVRSIFF